MGCSCSGPPGAGASPAGTPGPGDWPGPGGSPAGGGIALEPFPRQTLVGNATGVTSYPSVIYDSTRWKSIAWWFECYGSLPGTSGPPLTAYLETSESLNGPWPELMSQTASAKERYTGAVSNPGSRVRVRIDIQALEVSSVAFRIVARSN